MQSELQSELQNQQDKLLEMLERFSPVRNRYPVLLFLVRTLMILTPGDFKDRELFGKLWTCSYKSRREVWAMIKINDDSRPLTWLLVWGRWLTAGTTKHYWIKTKSWLESSSPSLTTGQCLITMLILICNNNRGNWLRYYSLRSVR